MRTQVGSVCTGGAACTRAYYQSRITRAAAAPPPNAILGDALAHALNQHAGHNPRGASERAPAESEDLLGELEEEMLVRRAIALTSSLRLEAPVFVPVLRCAAMS